MGIISALIKGVVDSVWGAISNWLLRRRVEKAENRAAALESFHKADVQAIEQEKVIHEAAEEARTNASADFTTLR